MLRKLLLILCIAILIGIYYCYLSNYITLDNIKYYQTELQHLVKRHPYIAGLLFIGMYTISITLALPVASLLTLTAGFLFGVFPGSLYAVIGATLGATLSFLIVRYLVGETFQKRYKESLAAFNKNIEKKGSYYLLSLRLNALIPFFLVNILSALTEIPLKTFVLTTALGIAPASLIFTYAGKQLGSIESVGDVFTPQVIIALLALATFALLPALLNKRHKPLA